jgi:sugar-specific transcriptional regulator TrmB
MEEKLRVMRALGLSEYEAKAYIALLSVRSAVPREVASLAGIPYPSAYDALENLAKREWVDVAQGRPRRYRARSPESILKESVGALERVFAELEKTYESSRERAGKPEIVYTVIGRAGVVKKIHEVLSRARNDAVIVFPRDDELMDSLARVFNSLAKKGVRLRIITDSEVHLKNVEVRTRRPILAVDVLVDGREAILGLPDCSACGWVENHAIAEHFGEFLKLLWESSGAQ